jgi:cytoskeletal protein RodZ
MKEETLGQVFKRYREAEGIKIERVEKDIKISHRMIEALENDDYRTLPDELYIRNIIMAYARYLSLDYNKLLALYNEAKLKKTDHEAVPKAKPVKVLVTPQRIRNSIIALVIIILLAYLGFQLNQIFQPPVLVISAPEKNAVITENFIEINGKTEKEARVYINEKEVFLNINGEFKATLDLQKGLNLIKITAVKKHSKENTVYREILVQ